MTIIEKKVWVHPNGNLNEQPVLTTASYEIYGSAMPKELNYPARLRLSGCAPVYLMCSHQDGDVFLAYPIDFWTFVKLHWHRIQYKRQMRKIQRSADAMKTRAAISKHDDGVEEVKNY